MYYDTGTEKHGPAVQTWNFADFDTNGRYPGGNHGCHAGAQGVKGGTASEMSK